MQAAKLLSIRLEARQKGERNASMDLIAFALFLPKVFPFGHCLT